MPSQLKSRLQPTKTCRTDDYYFGQVLHLDLDFPLRFARMSGALLELVSMPEANTKF